MIQLRDDCLFFRHETGKTVPCSVEQFTIELMGGSVDVLDPEIIRHAAAGVLHYFKVELGRESVTVAEFSEALARVLNSFGVEVEYSSATDVAAVAEMNLASMMEGTGKGFELEFFARLRRGLQECLSESPRLVRINGLRPCVKRLAGRRRWSAQCRRLEAQIITFVQELFYADSRSRGVALILR